MVSMRSRSLSLFFCLVLGAGVSGCASIVKTVDEFPPDFYGGTAFDWTTLVHPEETGELPFFALLDLPLSFVLDTALIPVHGLLKLGHWMFGEDDPEANGD